MVYIRRVIGTAIRGIVNMATNKYNVVFVLGGPGAGKGTQCSNIVKEFGYVHLSAGELLRAERADPDSKDAQLIDDFIKQGKIIPVEITCRLLEKAMERSSKCNFLIDGFPRNQDNLDGWTKTMDAKTNLQFVLFFDCSVNVCVQRCLSRGQAGSGRSDDNIESITKRIETYNQSTMPIIEHFQRLDLVEKISADASPDQVFETVKPFFKSLSTKQS